MNNFPSKEVLKSFGTFEKPINLSGGQGQNFRSGNIVLKPTIDNEETNWLTKFYSSFKSDKFRFPIPIKSRNGEYVIQGWQAWELLEGNHFFDSWDEIIKFCFKFHDLISSIPKPDYFDRRDQNPWVIADKFVWEDCNVKFDSSIQEQVEKLRSAIKNIEIHNQLIHGDFGGNILFSNNYPPAVIDFSPYWRPVEFAVGIVIADAIVWGNAKFSLIDKYCSNEIMYQNLLRAELRRVVELQALKNIYKIDKLNEIDAHIKIISYLT